MRKPALLLLLAGGIIPAVACGSNGSSSDIDPADAASPTSPTGTSTAPTASTSAPSDPPPITPDGSAPAPCVPSTATWSSMIPGPGQAGFDATLAANVARYDRLHEAVVTKAVGLAGTITVTSNATMRQKVEAFLGSTWDANDTDPTDDLQQYEGIDPFEYVTSWGFATGMYAGAEMMADAYRYAVLRDRGGGCTEMARARKMLEVGLEGFHVAVAITGIPGGIARAIMRNDLPGDGEVAVTPLKDGSGKPLPPEKNNGTWRADNSVGKLYPKYSWVDSCSRDMLFGWTMGIAAVWEVIKDDPTYPAALKARLQADAKSLLDGLRVVRSSGKDLEIWDPDGRRTYHGNLHETSIDRDYVIKNGVASMMALGEVAGLASVVEDASSKQYLDSLVTTRDLPGAIKQSMQVIALGGDKSNHSAFNMLFMTAWMANRYISDAATRGGLTSPVNGLYAPLFGERPIDWKQSFYDLTVAAQKAGAWTGRSASTSVDTAAVGRALDSLKGFPQAPFYAVAKENCNANEIANQSCVLLDGTTIVSVKTTNGELVANKPLPLNLRPASNYFWRSNPFLVNGTGNPNVVYPGSDLRVAYWMGRYLRAN